MIVYACGDVSSKDIDESLTNTQTQLNFTPISGKGEHSPSAPGSIKSISLVMDDAGYFLCIEYDQWEKCREKKVLVEFSGG